MKSEGMYFVKRHFNTPPIHDSQEGKLNFTNSKLKIRKHGITGGFSFSS